MSKDTPIESYIWQILKAVASFAAVIVYSRYLGASGRGTLSVYLLYVQMLLMINEMFVGSALANWISQFGLRRFLPRIVGVSLGILGLAAALALLLGFPPEEGKASALSWLHPAAVLVLLLAWSALLIFQNVAMNFFQSRGAVLEKNKWLLGFEILKLLGLLGLILGFTQHYGSLILVLGALVLSGFLGGIACFWRLKTLSAFSKRPEHSELNISHTWWEGIWAQLGQIALFFVYRIPVLWASYALSDAAAGILANALLVVDTVWIFANTFGSVLHSRALNIANLRKRERMSLRFMAYSFWGTLVLVLALAAVPAELFAWVFGADFYPMKHLIMLGIPGILALAVFAPLGNLFHAQNQFKRLLLHHTLGLIVMVLCLGFFKVFQDSVNFTQLIFAWNLALCTVMALHIFRRNYLETKGLLFRVNTLLIWRLLKKTVSAKGMR